MSEIYVATPENLKYFGPTKVAVCGDSLTEGSVSFNWVDKLKQVFNDVKKHVIENYGRNSRTTISWEKEYLQKVIDSDPDMVSLCIGTNDCNGSIREPEKYTIESFEANLRHIVSELQKNTKAKIALSSIPPIGENPEEEIFKRSAEYSQVIKKVAQEMGCTYLPLHENMIALLAKKNKTTKSKFSYPGWVASMTSAIIKKRIFGKSYQEISHDAGNMIHVDYLHLNDSALELAALNKEFIDSYHHY